MIGSYRPYNQILLFHWIVLKAKDQNNTKFWCKERVSPNSRLSCNCQTTRFWPYHVVFTANASKASLQSSSFLMHFYGVFTVRILCINIISIFSFVKPFCAALRNENWKEKEILLQWFPLECCNVAFIIASHVLSFLKPHFNYYVCYNCWCYFDRPKLRAM